MRERFIVVLLLTTLLETFTFGQQGSLKGTIIDTKTGETLIGATVVLEGTTTGSITDFDGNYLINNIQPGKYNILCSYISYETQVIENITISEEEVSELNFSLSEALTALEEVKVVAKKRRESEQMLLVERKEASIAMELIGAQELAKKGAGNVASGVKKISGVSMIGSKQLFVRGLGDRYNALQINGLPITSPDPTKKIIRLDLFSSDIVEALTVNKVFSADKYADYTGAMINIQTKAYPVKPFVRINYGVGYNSISSFSDFKQMNSAGNNFWGLSTSERKNAIPAESKTYDRTDRYNNEIFSTDFNHSNNNAFLNQSFSLSAGKLFNLGKRQLGVLFTASFENDYANYLSIKKNTLRRDGTNEDDWTYDSYEYGTNLSSLLSVSYKHNADNNISYNLFYLNSSNDRFKEIFGRDNENRSIYSHYNEFENHNLINNQLFGFHNLTNRLTIDWGASYGITTSDLPDLRQIKLEELNNDFNFYTADQQGTYRINLELEEMSTNGRLGFTYKIVENGKLKVGAQGKYVSRSLNTYVHYYDVNGISDIAVDPPSSAGQYITDENFDNGDLQINNGSTWDNKYDGTLTVFGGYLNYIHTFNQMFTLDLGIRAEMSTMDIQANSSGGNPIPVVLEGNDFFPTINLRYKLNSNSNLRFAASRTITRPSFHEKSPAKIPPRPDEDAEYGNQDIVNSFSNNIELKYEIFPRANELFSIGIYGKSLEDPIERITRPTGGGTIYTYQNTKNGVAAGIETEAKKKFNNLFAGVNLALIYTYVQTPENDNGTNAERRLQGASPYLINADLGYIFNYGRSKNLKTSVAVIYNVFGERIYSVGSDGKGDIYQLPIHSLDLLIRNNLNKGLELNFKVKNILNAKNQYEQDYYGSSEEPLGRLPIEGFQKGIEATVTIGYKF